MGPETDVYLRMMTLFLAATSSSRTSYSGNVFFSFPPLFVLRGLRPAYTEGYASIMLMGASLEEK